MRAMHRHELASSNPREPRARGRMCRTLSFLPLLLFLSASISAAEPIDYDKQIKPIFAARCKACHGVLKQEAGLRLDTGAFARKGGDSGKVITPNKSASSELIARISSSDPSERMPQEGEPLTGEQISALRSWIDH